MLSVKTPSNIPVKMLKLCVFFSFLISSCYSHVIDYSLTQILTINDSNSYFGYSVLLQRGNPPIAIVGAPKRKRNNRNTGSVFKCDLNTLHCSEYSNILRDKGFYSPNKNGDFLGSVLDGDDVAGSIFFTCAPRFVRQFDKNNHYVNGRCFRLQDSINLNERALDIDPLNSETQIGTIHGTIAFYDAALGEAGLSLQYSRDESELLIGAPGKTTWIGALVRTKLKYGNHMILSVRPDFDNYSYNYYGYALSWGKFIKNSKTVWYVSGAPRGGQLEGNVVFFEVNSYGKYTVKADLLGEEFGSYFGSSLLTLHNVNGGDDLLVGAPTYSGKTWDEGCVYYYKNKGDGTFHTPSKLLGKGPNSRFGTAISELGDIDLDSFQDCAISAPSEDDGVGAVYLYYGSSTGFSSSNFHKISPSNFETHYPKSVVVRGFGTSVSKGNDVDNNGHNDIVIGAYKSGVAFYFRTRSLLDIEGNITSTVKTLLTTTTQFSIHFCLIHNYRNKQIFSNSFITQILLLDDRVINNKNITATSVIQSGQLFCRNHTVQLKKDYAAIEPLEVIYNYKLSRSDTYEEKILKIPISLGCGIDNICQTNISIKASAENSENLIIGLVNELKIFVTIINTGEPAYQAKFYLTVPSDISLINLRECFLEDESYVCMVAQILRSNSKFEKTLHFDLSNIEPSRTNLSLDFRVESLGRNVDSKNRLKVVIPTLLKNNPYIDSNSIPASIGVSDTMNTVALNHIFLVRNHGPSPLNLYIMLLVPKLSVNNSDVIEIESVDGLTNSLPIECTYLNGKSTDLSHTSYEYKSQSNNNSGVLSCFELKKCTEVFCKAGYLPKSSQNVIFSVKLKIHTDSLVKFSKNSDNLIIASAAYLNNGTNQITAFSATLVYGLSNGSHIPLWVYVVSAISGIILLLIIIYGLYKCNFFKRDYKEKLECEQGIMENCDSPNNESQEEEEPAPLN